MSSRRLTFHLIPHTHWDREWYLPRAAFQARLSPATDALVELLSGDPDARFTLDGQTILLDDVLAVRPELRAALASLIATGRLAIGPWHVLADEQIPDGESLLRNLLIGAATAREFGGRMEVLYSPDAFGHPAALPMLAREFGLTAAVAWRGLGGSADSGDLYRWHAPSGDALLLHHLPRQGYEIGAELLDAGPQLPLRWRTIRDTLTARATSAQIAVFIGADHHAPPTEIRSLREALQELEREHDVVVSTVGEFCAAAQSRQTLPVLHGELRWSYGYAWTLQGVHATRSRMKRQHAAVELLLSRRAEPLAALAAMAAGLDQRGLLQLAWRTLVESQFHDTLGGCAADSVAAEQTVRLTSVEAMAGEIHRSSLAALAGHDADRARRTMHRNTATLLLWNPLPRARGGIVTASITAFRRDVLVGPPSGRMPRTGEGYLPFALVGADGERLPVQLVSLTRELERIDAPRHYPDLDEVDRAWVAFESPSIAGLALNSFHLEADPLVPAASGLETGDGWLSNRHVKVMVSLDGSLHVTDRETGEEYPDLLRLEDETDLGDCYTVYVPADATPSSRTTPRSRSVVAEGPLVGLLEVRWSLATVGGSAECHLAVELRADSPLVRLRLTIDNQNIDHRLRARFPVAAGGEAIAGAAFGFEHRPAEAFAPEVYPAETPVRTAPAHRYVAAGSGPRGLVLLAPGFLEYEWTPRRDLIVTLLRSVGELSKADLPTRPGHAGWPTATPDAQEQGRHAFEFALVAGGAELIGAPARLEAAWEDACLPLETSFIRDFSSQGEASPPLSITLEGDGLVCSAIKPRESGDGLVLRCFNVTDHPVAGRWLIGAPIARALAMRADETTIAPLTVTAGREISFEAPPRRIVTIGIEA